MYREGCTGRSNGPLLNPANVSYELDVPEMYREHKHHLSTFWSLCQAPSATLAPQVITEVGQAYQAPKLDHGTPTNEPMSTKIDGQHLSGYVPGGVPGYIYIYMLKVTKNQSYVPEGVPGYIYIYVKKYYEFRGGCTGGCTGIYIYIYTKNEIKK